MTDKSVHDATEEWVRHSITKEFTPIDINDVYKAFAAGARWQSQQAQVEPFAYCHLDVNGKAKELCSAPCADDDPRDTRTVQALYKHPPSPSAVPDEAFNIIEGIRAELTWGGWRSAHSRDWVMDSLSELLSMLTASPCPPAKAQVPEGWRLVPVEPTLGMLAALAWAGDEDLALGHAEINREIISNYGAMLAASPAPEHSGDGNEMVTALRQYRHNDGGGFVFAYDKEQTDRIVTGLVKALEPFAECASELDGSPEDGIEPTDDDEWAKFRLLVSDYRRARAALAAYRKQGGEA